MAGARPPAEVGAPGAGFHGVAPAGDDVARCAETGRTRDTGEGSGRSAAAGAIAAPAPGEIRNHLGKGRETAGKRNPEADDARGRGKARFLKACPNALKSWLRVQAKDMPKPPTLPRKDKG